MKIGHIELPISDPMASRQFYEHVLGAKIEQIQGERFIWLTLGETVLLLNPGLEAPSGELVKRPNLVFYTSRLAERVAELEAKGVRFHERHGCFHFEDPDGNAFQLVDPGGDHSGT